MPPGPLPTHDLNALAAFAAVAEAASFRAAADRLGVTRSAVSQTLRRLERSLGVALMQRTTRSVRLTEAGERLYAQAAPALATLGAAVEELGTLAATPRGRLRLAVSSIAEDFLAGPLLATFAAACPAVELDVVVTDAGFDIVAHGFDAGVRLGEVIAEDMVAVPVGAPQRQLAVCAPAYAAAAGQPLPRHPAELARHRCIGWRPAPEVAPYRWEFAEHGREFAVEVPPSVTTNDMALMVRLALAGAGIAFGLHDTFRPWLARGELLPLLADFSPPFPGFYLYYPSRRDAAPKLRALIRHVLDWQRIHAPGAPLS